MNEQHSFAVSAGDNEVPLHISDTASVVDFLGSLVNHALPLNACRVLFPAWLSVSHLFPVRLNLPAVRTPNECADGHTGHIRQLFSIPLHAP